MKPDPSKIKHLGQEIKTPRPTPVGKPSGSTTHGGKSRHPIEWWEKRVPNYRKEGDQFAGECPKHDDGDMSSLKLKPDGTGTLVYDHGGCDWKDIEAHYENPVRIKRDSPPSEDAEPVPDSKSDHHPWVEYTHVTKSVWKYLGTAFHSNKIVFHFEGTNVTKTRLLKPKKGQDPYYFSPRGAPIPPLWPMPNEDNVKEIVYISEGESDCGCLRAGGFAAFSITTGAGTIPKTNPFPELERLGVKEIRIIYDADDKGREGAFKLAGIIPESLTTKILDIGEILDPLLGEKDVRNLALRCTTYDEFVAKIESLGDSRFTRLSFVQIEDFMAMPKRRTKWLVEKVYLAETTGMIVGPPKIGKSWLAIDLGISLTSGEPFLNEFEVLNQGPVLYISKEDPDYLLEDRIYKVLKAKGLADPSISINGSNGEIIFPGEKRNWPMFIETSREFFFTDLMARELLRKVEDFTHRVGPPALVIIDPLLRMMDNLTDEFKASDVANDIYNRLLEPLRRDFMTASLLIHHTPKSSFSAYGSVVFRAFSENSFFIRFEEPDAEGWVNVDVELKSAPGQDFAYRFVELDRWYEVEVGERRKKRRRSPDEQTSGDQLMAIFEDSPSDVFTAKDIADQLSLDPNYVMSLFKGLIKSKHLISVGKLDRDLPGRKPQGFQYNPDSGERSS